jgi:hypothetical protein
VFNLKWSALTGAFGFVLSLLVGLVSGAGIHALGRALIFGIAFFVIGSLLYWLAGRFLPDMLDQSSEGIPGLGMGSQVDISVDDDDIASLAKALRGDSPEPVGLSGSDGGIGDLGGGEFGIGELGGGGIGDGLFPSLAALDQVNEKGYTESGAPGSTAGPAEPARDLPARSFALEGPAAIPSGGTDALDVLPDLESMSQAFLPSMDDVSSKEGNSGEPVAVAFPGMPLNNRTIPEEAEEFRGREKETAQAIQTILKRD